jgi:signal transduction histidine kinase
MCARKFFFAAIVLVSLPTISISWAATDLASSARIAISAATTSKQVAKVAPVDELGYRLQNLLNSVFANRDLASYALLAAIAILFMGFAIGSAASNSRGSTDAQLKHLKREKEKAENLAKLKAEFLNQVSHELRTPLAVIIGYIECMTDGLYGEIESKHHEILQVVSKQSNHLKNMIDQILIYSRLEAGKQPIRIEELQVVKLVSDMRDTFDFLCRQKGLELRWELPREPVTIRSDAMRVKEVVSNLLQNAVKYTDHGSITVRLERISSGKAVKIEVEDTGMGISEQNLTSIFEPFMQAHKTSSTNSRGGIGLGLSIVKKHLEQIHSTITVTSELGKGSTFRIILPPNCENQSGKSFWGFNLSKLRAHRTGNGHLVAQGRPQTSAQKSIDPSSAVS